MNKKLTPIIIVLVIGIFVVLQAFFTVDETEVAIVTTFGEFKQSNTSPGLKMKTPFIDSVTKFDKRLQRVDVPPEALLTSDKKRLSVDAYARYRFINPLVFFKNLTNESTADSRIASIVASKIREEMKEILLQRIINRKNRVAATDEFVMKDRDYTKEDGIMIGVW